MPFALSKSSLQAILLPIVFYVVSALTLGFAYFLLIMIYRTIIGIDIRGWSITAYMYVKYLPALGIIATIELTSFVMVRVLISFRPNSYHIEPLQPGEVPEIDELLEEVRKAWHVRKFDRIYIVPDVAAGVFETNTVPFLPLPPKRRHLILGWPLLVHLTRRQLKAVLAHELAHFDDNAMFFQRSIYGLRTRIRNSISTWFWWDSLWRQRMEKASWNIVGIVIRGAWVLWRVAFLPYHVWCEKFWERLNAETRNTNHKFEFYCDRRSAEMLGSNTIIDALKMAAALDLSLRAQLAFSSSQDNVYHTLRRHFRIGDWPIHRLLESNQANDTHPSYEERFLNALFHPAIPDTSRPIIRSFERYYYRERELTKMLNTAARTGSNLEANL